MVSTKTRKNSGRYIPVIKIKELIDLYQVYWDDWIDWRDGFRVSYSKSWKDASKKKRQYFK